MKRPIPSAASGLRIVALIGAVVTLLVGLHVWLSGRGGPTAEQTVAHSGAGFEKDLLPFLRQYCAECHGDGAHEGDFTYDRYHDLDGLKRDRHVWTKVLRKLKSEAMPPADMDQPPAEERARVVKWLDHQLFFVDCGQPQDPGRVTVRRLNRSEYDNTVRDLLGVDFRPANDFPSDDTGHGLDNIGDVLTVPPLLVEKYLAAAEDIAERAVRSQSPLHSRTRCSVKPKGNVRDLVEGNVLIVKDGQIHQSFAFPRAGRYAIRVQARLDPPGDGPANMEVSLGTTAVHSFELKGGEPLQVCETVVAAEQGTHKVSAAVKDRTLHVAFIEVEGPLEFTDEERRAQPLVRDLPRAGVTPAAAARANLQRFLPRAFRREVLPEECERYVTLTQQALDRGDSFDQAMNLTLQAVLVSPHFLFRVEGGRRREAGVEMLDDFALASRLSYFLWSSMPDDELFQLAARNRLHDPEVLKQQTLRLLTHARADALVSNFASQWLSLRRLTSNDVRPDAAQFPGFDNQMRLDLWRETELFFGSIVRSNSSIYELLTARYSFLNERLARHYGITEVSGPEFRRVDFKDEPRAGVLTQGSFLTLTSHPARTSPVKRGEWVLTNLLGDAPPEPPPSVPTLEQTQAAHPTMTLRQQMERHRADPACATCHRVMDAIGFGLENFDPVGRWRDRDGTQSIDSKGALPGGEEFSGPIELIAILNKRKADFGRCLTEKLLTYALGRGVEWYDKCAVDEILARLEENDRFATLILAIVESAPFQMRRVQEPRPESREPP